MHKYGLPAMSLIGRIVVVVGVMMGARNEYPALYYFCLHWTIVLVCFGLAAQLRSLLKPWWGALFILVGLLLSPLLLPLFSEQIRAYLEVYFVVGLAFSLFVVVRWPESYIAEVNHQFRKVQRLREKDEFDKAKRIYERLKSKFSASEEIVAEAEEGLRKIRQIEENRLQTFESKKLYKKAMRLYGKGHWKEAHDIFRQIVEKYPSSELTVTAKSVLKSMHSIDDANRQMQRARKLHSGGKLVEAKRAYEKILSRFDFDSITEEVGNRLREIDPVLKEEANRKIQKAKELFQKGKLVEAKVAYEDIRRLYDFNSIIEAANNGLHKISQILEPETLYNEAIRFYGKGDREKARAIFARIVRDYPSSGLAEDARSFLKSMDG